ncbi:hypothetical protein LAZ67_3003050 [Cordylochernes scorpioides]|uniref:Uncharacterized protein n=1 Tax=Cordylochernes scorpioides TaxID=51811 RepID=A0ABY6KBK6_9ARAC|nr:hypothetical protein LAZ67_3003050 [Cordylochernes scorpioides]
MPGQILFGLSRKKLDKITLNGLPFLIEDSDVIKSLRPFCQYKNLGSQLAASSSQATVPPATTSFTPAPPATEVSAICDPVAVVSDPTPATGAEHETSSEKEEIVENKTTLSDEESLPGAKTRKQKQLAAVLRKTSSKLFEEAKNVRLNKEDVLRAIISPIFLTKYLKELDNVENSGLHLLGSKLVDKVTIDN